MNKPTSNLEPKDLRTKVSELERYINQCQQGLLAANTHIYSLQSDVQRLKASERQSGFIYVASPYSHAKPEVRQQRYQQVQWYVLGLLKQRSWCYSPIVHCHELAVSFGLPTEALYWMDYNCAMLSAANDLHVLCLPGWEESVGVKNEVAYWRHARERAVKFVPFEENFRED